MSRLGLHNLAGSAQFHSTPFRSLPSIGMLDRLNSPPVLGIHGLNLLQGMPMPLELDQIQSNKGVNYIPELPTHPGDTASFPVSSGSTDLKIIGGSSNSCFVGVSNKHLMLEEHGQGLQDGQKFGKQSSLSAGSLNQDIFQFSDHVDVMTGPTVQSNGVQSNSLTLNDCFKRSILHPSAIRESMSTMALQSRNNPCDVSSISTLPIHLQDSKADLPCQVGVATVSSNAGQLINNGPLGWDDHRQDDPYHSNGLSNSINSAIPINAMETLVRSRDGYLPSQEKPQDRSVLNNFDSLEDLVSVMVNQASLHVPVHFCRDDFVFPVLYNLHEVLSLFH
uniref:Uncharacterized protein n=1 Tax=Salix viminalis TaxID=40686 RepID=A0A6N2KHM4_SALVM